MKFVFFSSLVFLLSAPAHSAERPADELWVTFDVSGERYRIQVRQDDTEGAAYVRAFVAGRAPNRVPEKSARGWLAAAKLAADAEQVHVARAEECRDGACVPLRGLYAGRSPAF